MLFRWKDSFSCNVKAIDEQHKRLFELGSELNNLLSLKDDIDHYDDIVKVIEELKDYTVYHFRYEENLMEKLGYEALDEHKKEHSAFIDKILEIEKADIDADQNKAKMELLIFVADWIAKHIVKTDMRYKEFFNSKGIF